MDPTWLTAFLDLPADEFDPAVAFWREVTGYGLSAPRGEHDEFATLVPAGGDAFLRVQRVDDGQSRMHLDVHEPGREFAVRASPGGLSFCQVAGTEAVRPAPATWPGGHRSVVDQVCLDIPPEVYDAECRFWASLTGWELFQAGRPEFRRLRVPGGQPLNVLLQRLDSADGSVRAHLDLATDDRDAETRRHELLGATVAAVQEGWTVMRPPAGPAYCITGRAPRGESA